MPWPFGSDVDNLSEMANVENWVVELKVMEQVFDGVEEMLFYVKDQSGRYVFVNDTFVKRLGFESKSQMIGKAAIQVYPNGLGRQYSIHDLEILKSGVGFKNRLMSHLSADGEHSLALITKEPIIDDNGKIAGVCGITRDLNIQDQESLKNLEKILNFIEECPQTLLSREQIEELIGPRTNKLERVIKKTFKITLMEFIKIKKLEIACRKLARTDDKIVNIALEVGYSDQSAFSRQFKKKIGVTPQAYRDSYRERV